MESAVHIGGSLVVAICCSILIIGSWRVKLKATANIRLSVEQVEQVHSCSKQHRRRERQRGEPSVRGGEGPAARCSRRSGCVLRGTWCFSSASRSAACSILMVPASPHAAARLAPFATVEALRRSTRRVSLSKGGHRQCTFRVYVSFAIPPLGRHFRLNTRRKDNGFSAECKEAC
eukprot:1490425-Pleurochrysis_carterae.AAC.2